MKRFLFGLIAGLLIGTLGYFIVVPKIKDGAHTEGYEKGISEGTIKGIEQGKLEQKNYQDSINTLAKKKIEIRPKARKLQVPKEQVNSNNRNFHWNANGVWEEIK